MRDKEEIRINLSELLNQGNWILLFADEKEEEKINCQIVKFVGDNKCIVESADISESELPLDICIHHGTTTGLYKVDGVLQRANNDDKMVLDVADVGVKIQERRFIRLAIQKEAKMAILNRPAHKGEQFQIKIENISAGGAKLRSEEEVLTGFFVEIDLSELEKFPFDKLTAEVLWDNIIEKDNNQLYETGVHFICSEKERNKIARYVNEKQLEFRRKGKL